jgi:hypothetical protein
MSKVNGGKKIFSSFHGDIISHGSFSKHTWRFTIGNGSHGHSHVAICCYSEAGHDVARKTSLSKANNKTSDWSKEYKLINSTNEMIHNHTETQHKLFSNFFEGKGCIANISKSCCNGWR